MVAYLVDNQADGISSTDVLRPALRGPGIKVQQVRVASQPPPADNCNSSQATRL